ncbi:MAG: hypothetical protein IT454_00705 [Planctomycetes bacterium]|nr:hypothetical protein [Planctomycetota bacterium]
MGSTQVGSGWLKWAVSASTAAALLASPARAGEPATHLPEAHPAATLEIPFVENQGQMHPAVHSAARCFAGTVFVTHCGEVVYRLAPQRHATAFGPRPLRESTRIADERAWSVVERFAGGDPSPRLEQRSATSVSVFRESAPSPRTTAWSNVDLGAVWPGIRVELRAHGDNVEKLFEVAPGADVARIAVQVDGAHSLSLASDGALVCSTGLGDVSWTAPLAYQIDVRGERRDVEVHYTLIDGGYGFVVGEYDRERALVIDPLLRSTYLGGSGWEYALAVAVSGNDVFIAGTTGSDLDFPGTTGGAQATSGGAQDGFVARLDLGLSTLVQATYFGGSNYDRISALAVTSNEVVVAGDTGSNDLPGTGAGAFPFASGGGSDAFAARFSRDLGTLLSATYFGGSQQEELDGGGTALVRAGNGWVFTGWTTSSDLPVFLSAPQTQLSGSFDAFVVSFDASLGNVLGATYLGGSDLELPGSVAVFGNSVYVAGTTYSLDFPIVPGAPQTALNGFMDGFVVRYDNALGQLQGATYLGGSGSESALGPCVIATSSGVYVAGYTDSTDFPGTAGGAQPSYGGGVYDVFLARLSANLNALVGASYFGGAQDDIGYALCDVGGDVAVAGFTTDTALPGSAGGAQSTNAGASDVFVARFSPSLSSILRSTFIGGSADDSPNALATNAVDMYVVGSSSSFDLPLIAGSAQPFTNGGNSFCTRLTRDLALCGSGSSYCTSSTSTHGCQATMNASGTPSATASSGFVLTCANVEGQKAGLFFYGISGAQSVPWAASSTSFLCVKLPTQRTSLLSSGGTSSACNGSFTLDFLAFMSANPGALGQPLTVGQQFRAQTWFRDPPAPKTTNLSDAWQFSICP